MTEIGFYHLTTLTVDEALPALLGKTLAAGQRAVVLCGSPSRVAALDTGLWAAASPEWLPHGTARTGHAALQPIWITDVDECPNGARFAFLLDGMATDLTRWDRVFDLFDGRDEAAVAAARARWSAAKAAGHRLSYWRRTDTKWERQ